MRQVLTVGSLCTGYSGLDAAVELAGRVLGFEVRLVWVADNDPNVARLLAHRYPGVRNLGDLGHTDWATVERVDMVVAGFPCQDISPAGLRAGLVAGNRSGLWMLIARALFVLRPLWVFLENSGGLTSAKAQITEAAGGAETGASVMEQCSWCLGDGSDEPDLRALGRVLGDLADLRFDAEWTRVSASDVGAPHNRRRAFVLAWDAANPRAAGLEIGRLEPDRQQRPSAERSDRVGPAADTPVLGPGQRVTGAVRDTGGPDAQQRGVVAPADPGGQRVRDDPGELAPPAHRDARAGDQRQRGGRDPGDGSSGSAADPGRVREPAGRVAPAGQTPRRGALGAPVVSRRVGVAPDPDRDDRRERNPVGAPVGGTAAAGHSPRSWRTKEGRDYGPAIRRWELITGREAPNPVALTRTGIYRLNPAFSEWMMGLPAGWVTGVPGLSRTAQLHIIGNGVVPLQGAHAFVLLVAQRAATDARLTG